MHFFNTWIIVLMLLSNLLFLGTNSLKRMLGIFAFQGFLIGCLPLLREPQEGGAILFSLLIWALKAVIFPWLIYRALVLLR